MPPARAPTLRRIGRRASRCRPCDRSRFPTPRGTAAPSTRQPDGSASRRTAAGRAPPVRGEPERGRASRRTAAGRAPPVRGEPERGRASRRAPAKRRAERARGELMSGKALVLVVASLLAGCAGARQGPPRALPADRREPVVYVALGDSTGQGVGASSPERSYVSRLYERLRAAYPADAVAKVGVAGATSADVVAAQLQRAEIGRAHV